MTDEKPRYEGVDRRRYPRVNARIKYQIIEKEPAKKVSDMKNISAGGIAFFAKTVVEINNILSLSISLPDETDFKAVAQVIWQEKVQVSWDTEACYELGVQFVAITKDDRQKISKYAFLRLDKS